MHPIKRPKAGDTEDDLLKEEREFLDGLKSRKVTPAATVVRKPGKTDPKCEQPGKEKNIERHEDDSDSEVDGPCGSILHPVEAVLFEIKERAFDPLKLKEFTNVNIAPKVLQIPKTDTSKPNETSNSTRKKSLFARTFDARKEAKERASHSLGLSSQKNETKRDLPSVSGVVGLPKIPATVGDTIHPYLAGMTEPEILEEQRKLLERLDPKLVEFIKNRKRNATRPEDSTVQQKAGSQILGIPMEIEERGNDVGTSLSSSHVSVEERDLPIDPKLVEKYPGMDKIELPKLEWAGVVKDDVKRKVHGNQNQNVGKSARFDFSGMLLHESTDDPTTYERALHNHGDEMDRPGYTIEELLTLARSLNLQQRSIALDTLGQIFARAHTGFYDEVLEQNIFDLMDYMDLIHTVRKGLDNVDSNTINSALSCLASLVYPDLEEDCLDAVYLWPDSRPHPLLTANQVEKMEAEEEMKDFELLQVDLLEFLITRSDILTRIEYLLTTKLELFTEKGVTSVLKVLIRLARHSPSSVIKHERILRFVAENYVTPNWMTLSEKDKSLKGIPLSHALKLVRILAESSISNAMKLYKSYSILPSVMSYLAYDQWREQSHVHDVEQLILEAFKIWIGFLSFGIAIDEYLALFPVLMQFLTFYGLASELNSFDLHHSAHLFALLTQILYFGHQNKRCQQKEHSHWELVKDAASCVEKHCIKMMKILASPQLQGTYSIDLAVLSLGKGIEFLNQSMKYCDKEAMQKRLQTVLVEFSRSATYSKLTSNLVSHSIILAKISEKHRYSSNFASLGVTKWKGELHPLMRPNSPYHFLKYFLACTRSLCGENAFKIVIDSNVENYLSSLRHNSSSDCVDYFIRFELSCLYEILATLPKDFKGKFAIAYDSLVHIPSCCTILFEALLKVALETCCKLDDLEAVYNFYALYFLGETSNESKCENMQASSSKTTKVKFDDGSQPGDSGTDEDPKILFQKWTKKITEAHWMFHPLENLYKRVNSTPGYVKDNLSILEQETRGCLSFICHCLLSHNDSIVQTPQDLVTVYCRICRVFMLGSPSVYIDIVTIPVLKEILQILLSTQLLKNSTKPIFSKHKPSNSAAVSFFDFYTELVNEYFDNSYYNEVFAAYLFLPLRSAEDENVKTCFWKHEYLSCVKVSRNEFPVPLTYLTQNPEKDQRMLSMYTHMLKRNVIICDKNPLLYEIVTTHLRNSVEFMTEKLRSDFESLCI